LIAIQRGSKAMQTTKVSFINDDGQALSGLLDFPTGPARAYALFAH